MSFKSYGGQNRVDTDVTIIHGKNPIKKPTIGGAPQKKDVSQVIKMAKIENEEVGLRRITHEFAQAIIAGRSALSTGDKSFTQKDLALRSGVPIQIIQGYEKTDTLVDTNFEVYCKKIAQALNLRTLPKIVAHKRQPLE